MTAASRTLIALVAASLLVAACGDDDEEDVSSDTTATTEAVTTTAGEATTTADGGDLPGERIDIFPYEGAQLAVVGVAHDDTLNVRAGPGVDFDVVDELGPTALGVTATGHVRDVGDAFWTEVETDATTGWVNVRYVGHLGATDDITSQLGTPAELPTGASVLEVGMAVAERRTSNQVDSDVVVVTEPSVGDLGEVTIDVIGYADDSLGGERLRVFVATEDGGETYAVKSVERTLICTRGVAEGGLCL